MQEWESGRTPTLLPCSRNARPEKGLVRRPQLEQHGCPATRNGNRTALIQAHARQAVPLQYGGGKRIRSGQTALFTRGTRTMKRCSFDARSQDHLAASFQYWGGGIEGKKKGERPGDSACSMNARSVIDQDNPEKVQCS